MIWANYIMLSENQWADGVHHAEKIFTYAPELRCDKQTWDRVIDEMVEKKMNMLVIDLGDGVQYKSHPEIAIKGAWTVEYLKAEIARLKALGITAVPKLNFSTTHDAWLHKYEKMVSTPIYYEVCRDIINEACEIFGKPSLFHIGMDEEELSAQSRQEYASQRHGDLWWHDFNFFVDCVRENGAKAWIWADGAWVNPDEFVERMPKDVVMTNWAYGHIYPTPDGTAYKDFIGNTFPLLEKHGFKQIPCSSTWVYRDSWVDVMRVAKKEISEENLLGYMTAAWMQTWKNHEHRLLDDICCMDEARRIFYPETLEDK